MSEPAFLFFEYGYVQLPGGTFEKRVPVQKAMLLATSCHETVKRTAVGQLALTMNSYAHCKLDLFQIYGSSSGFP